MAASFVSKLASDVVCTQQRLGTHGVIGRAGSGYVLVTLSRDNIVGNTQFGMLADGATAGSRTEIVVGNSVITDNFGGAAQALGNATLYSTLTNEILFMGPATFQQFPCVDEFPGGSLNGFPARRSTQAIVAPSSVLPCAPGHAQG